MKVLSVALEWTHSAQLTASRGGPSGHGGLWSEAGQYSDAGTAPGIRQPGQKPHHPLGSLETGPHHQLPLCLSFLKCKWSLNKNNPYEGLRLAFAVGQSGGFVQSSSF